ncbi:Glycosyltransferase involved in cell wall bisynthesis [Meinhardsimonia xiamenensis]|jgi:glycosyltransferase involved in cell wall biosynthesis|uniref:Glycosyltransferase involved in cell wall bisynthesis n=1 Tax=Meinhardsimonia xiamenensis TaxID=990712 RepID=A0A1G9E602_9RHOB|nr:glycosyltransferase family 4 protein [Meinhardsimonia xiamenensis]PRX33911.1 glycosyltransferase involved in cell wall biosynthesis [Meinhardsimonia xiamenensis]SDK71564.1 Glycosyltransferase involved in cell wall bisynthesis [Meinhardsimonia xiamenensis]
MRLLLAHGDLAAAGGAEAYAEAIIASLARIGHAPDVLDIHGLRRCDAARVDRILLRLGRMPVLRRFHLLKYALVCRLLPRVARGYDGVILSYGEGPPLEVPTLVLRHAPALFSARRSDLEALGAAGRGALYLRTRQAYALAMRWLAGPKTPGPASMTVTNSRWTAARLPRSARPATLVYPRVVPPRVGPQRRLRHRILMLGRMERNKRIEEGIAIVERLRAEGLPAELDVAGRAATAHARRLLRRHAGREWLRFHPDASPATVATLLAQARFGLHCYRNEHFGIAVAEMICAGLVPVVFDGGGVCELVTEPELRFANAQEAAARLFALMMRPAAELEDLSRRLRQGEALRAALNFEDRLEPVLARFLDKAG